MCSSRPWWPRVLTCFALLCCLSSASAADSKVDRLVRLRDQSKSGVISLDTANFHSFTSGSSRPYTLIVFCNAAHLKEGGQLKLPEVFEAFQLMAKHVRQAAKKKEYAASANKIFFVEIEFKSSRDLFSQLGVSTLPWVLHIGPNTAQQSSGVYKIPQASHMKVDEYTEYPWKAHDFAHFVRARTNLDFGEIFVPKLTNNPLFLIAVMLSILPLAWLGWRVYTSSWIGQPIIWTVACLAVFMFATSGGLYNIIRGVPLTTLDQRTKKLQWYQRGQGQLGLEGFTVGSMYVAFAVAVTLLMSTPRVFGDSKYLRVACYAQMAVIILLTFRIIDFFTWKVGYRPRYYILDWIRS